MKVRKGRLGRLQTETPLCDVQRSREAHSPERRRRLGASELDPRIVSRRVGDAPFCRAARQLEVEFETR